MIRLAANLSLLYTEHDFLDRFAAAAASGFKGVECQFPYAFSAEQIARELKQHQLEQVLINLPAGDWESGERGIACHPDRRAEFRDGVEQALSYAALLGNRRINCLAGIPPIGVSADEARTTLIENLRFAAKRLQEAQIQLLVEAINTRDVPGFYLNRSTQTLELIAEVGSPNLALQYDVYHMQIMEGDLSHTLATHLNKIGHVQIADTPGRHEPGTGEINYPFILNTLDRLGYDGWVSGEYVPATTTDAGLGWIEACGLKL